MKKIKIGIGQLSVETGRPEININRARNMIIEAGNSNCDIIVLPECLDLGWTFPDSQKLARYIPGKYSDIICKAAQKAEIYVVVGLTEKTDNGIYNSAIFVSAAGDIMVEYCLMNRFPG